MLKYEEPGVLLLCSLFLKL